VCVQAKMTVNVYRDGMVKNVAKGEIHAIAMENPIIIMMCVTDMEIVWERITVDVEKDGADLIVTRDQGDVMDMIIITVLFVVVMGVVLVKINVCVKRDTLVTNATKCVMVKAVFKIKHATGIHITIKMFAMDTENVYIMMNVFATVIILDNGVK